MFPCNVHPSLVRCRIRVGAPGCATTHTLVPVDRGRMVSTDRLVEVLLRDLGYDQAPYLVQTVRYCGQPTELYSLVPNGKKRRRSFART